MKKILVPVMLVIMLLVAGCDSKPPDNPPPDKPSPTEPVTDPKPNSKPVKPVTQPETPTKPDENPPKKTETDKHTMNIKIYYPDDSGLKLVEVERKITFEDEFDKYTVAVEMLREDPGEANLTRIFPSNASLRSVTVDDDMAIVDFDGSILKGFVGGSTGEEFLIGSIVDTLTNFPEVKRVKFLVNGEEIETLSGHMDLSTPLERMSNLIQ